MPPAPITSVFISYRRDDTAGDAGWLEEHLLSRFGPGSVFMDIDSIQPGVDWVQVLTDAVTNCNVLLALIGPRWLTATTPAGSRRLDDPADFVRTEIASALQHGRPVIPVLVHGAPMPQAADLPPALSGLTRRQAIEINDNYRREGVQKLLDAIARTAGAPVSPAPSVRKRGVWAIPAIVGVLALAVIAAVLVHPWTVQGAKKNVTSTTRIGTHGAVPRVVLNCMPGGTGSVRCGVQGSGFPPDESVVLSYHNPDLRPGAGLLLPPGATLGAGVEDVPITTNGAGGFTRHINLSARPDFRLQVTARGAHGESARAVWTGLPS